MQVETILMLLNGYELAPPQSSRPQPTHLVNHASSFRQHPFKCSPPFTDEINFSTLNISHTRCSRSSCPGTSTGRRPCRSTGRRGREHAQVRRQGRLLHPEGNHLQVRYTRAWMICCSTALLQVTLGFTSCFLRGCCLRRIARRRGKFVSSEKSSGSRNSSDGGCAARRRQGETTEYSRLVG